ncbi:MAG: type II secretion system secretin GspD, partial [Pseudomonadota bacterium]
VQHLWSSFLKLFSSSPDREETFVFKKILIVSTLIILSGCAMQSNTLGKSDSLWQLSDARSSQPQSSRQRSSSPLQNSEVKGQRPQPWLHRGNRKFISSDPIQYGPTLTGGQGVTINLVNVRVSDAAKLVLNDILSLNYSIASGVSGTITLQTARPIPTAVVLDIFEDTLRLSGIAMVQKSGVYNIVQASAAEQTAPIAVGKQPKNMVGVGVQVIPLRFISASEMARVIQPAAPQGAVMRVDTSRNLILVRGTRREITNILEMAKLFDVDWMRGMSFGVFPVENSNPLDLVKELETLFGQDINGQTKDVVRFIPNNRLGAVLVISSSPDYLKRADQFIEKLESMAERRERRLFVYKIQNRPAGELAELLQKILESEGRSALPTTTADGDTTTVAPRFTPTTVESETEATTNTEAASNQIQSRQQGGSTTKVVADIPNNSLLIRTFPGDYKKILSILERLDVLPTQVLMEAVIAEVSLNDELRYGIKWFFQKKDSQFTFSDAAAGAISSVFPGFSYFFETSDIQVALDALSGVTKVNVVSAPSLVVMDSRTATLQIGDQVPVVTQTSQGTQNADAPVVNTVELKDTGVILEIKPRVNDAGKVILDISQEVSSVTRTTSSGIDSPTIQQRKIKTTVVVGDGEVLALGGLIEERSQTGKQQVPVLGQIPVIGSAFRQKEDIQDRTELVIFIRPQIVRDVNEGRRITDEFRKRLNEIKPRTTPTRNIYESDLKRAID